MTERSVSHGTFVVERTYPAEPARVFAAWASWEAKGVWMDDPDYKSDGTEGEFDFRVGGYERFGGLTPEGTTYRYDARYYDIVAAERIVYCYEMYAGEDRMSVSVATVQIEPDDGGTRLTYTEQGAFLDGIDTLEARQGGTEWMLDNLTKYLAAQTES
ncbi:MAG TPA: SRPBCC family protein [Streptosporangiaceae bacterium]|nr:SRPBCC family protein [Streptosporangiaceae bacterium]